MIEVTLTHHLPGGRIDYIVMHASDRKHPVLRIENLSDEQLKTLRRWLADEKQKREGGALH